MVVAVGEWVVVPAVVVFEAVVLPTQGGEIVCGGGSAVGPGGAVVEVTVRSGHPAPRENTPGIGGGDGAAL